MKTGLKLALAGALAISVTSVSGAAADDVYRMTTSAPGSSTHMVMTTFAEIVNARAEGMKIEAEYRVPAPAQALAAAHGESDFYLAPPTVHDWMLRGVGPYADVEDAPTLATRLRALFNFPLGVYHVITHDDSGIASLDDLRGKRVFLGPPRSGANRVASMMIEAATGLTPGQDFELLELSWEDGEAAFRDRRVDVFSRPSLAPAPVIERLASTDKIRILGLTDSQLNSEAMRPSLDRPGGTVGMISAGTYGENQVNESDVAMVASVVGLGTNVDLPVDVGYAVTKAFWEGLNELEEPHPWLAQVTLDGALNELNMPLHAGAVLYYRELGMTIPEAATAD